MSKKPWFRRPGRVIPLAALALGAGLLIAPLGVVLAHLARARLRRTGEEGWGVATAGLAIGYAGLGLAALLVVVIGLSGLLIAPLGR